MALAARAFVGWEGRSPLTGDRVVLVFTGASANSKTGPMWQAWLLLDSIEPFEAVKLGADAAICGGCIRRGEPGGARRSCYVSLFNGPVQIYRTYRAGGYPVLTPIEAAARLAGEHLRVSAYGDPVILPFAFWSAVLHRAAGWVGYTHLWRICDQRYRALLMASVDDDEEQADAAVMGWRTFRVRTTATGAVHPWEFVCPASEEGGHRSTCARCQLCRGTASPAKSVVIVSHERKARPGEPRGKYDDLKATIERGQRATLTLEPRSVSRVILALRQHYRRHGEPRGVHQHRVDDSTSQVWLS